MKLYWGKEAEQSNRLHPRELKHAYAIVSTEWSISVLLDTSLNPGHLKGNLDQAGVGHIPTLCTMLPHSVQKLYRALTSSGLFGIIIWNSSVTVYWVWERVTLLKFFNFSILLFASPRDVALAQSKKCSPGL